jgi:hypothetical protein
MKLGFSLSFEVDKEFPKTKGGIDESYYFYLSISSLNNGGVPKYFTVKRGTKKAIEAFKDYENGIKELTTKDAKNLHRAIKGKAAWGLWSKEYAIGFATFLTTWEELKELNIPNKFMKDIYMQANKLRYSPEPKKIPAYIKLGLV